LLAAGFSTNGHAVLNSKIYKRCTNCTPARRSNNFTTLSVYTRFTMLCWAFPAWLPLCAEEVLQASMIATMI
jgi:hypothetical protein